MKKINIIEKETDEMVKDLTEEGLLNLIREEGLIDVLSEWEIPESFLLKWGPEEPESFSKSVIMTICNLSEEFIREAIKIEWFEDIDIFEMNMKTYSNFTEEFIKEYQQSINWERMMVLISSRDEIKNIWDFVPVIEKWNLWKMVSANDLPIEFIREYKDKLDWVILKILGEFTDEEREEFKDYLPVEIDFIESELSDPLSTTEIFNLVKNVEDDEENRFEVNHIVEQIYSDKMKDFRDFFKKVD